MHMPQAKSRLYPEIDFDAPGKRTGFLRLPHSVHRSAYGWIPIPIVAVANGSGPRVLLMGGNHGDEYEGQVALGKLIPALDPGDVECTVAAPGGYVGGGRRGGGPPRAGGGGAARSLSTAPGAAGGRRGAPRRSGDCRGRHPAGIGEARGLGRGAGAVRAADPAD